MKLIRRLVLAVTVLVAFALLATVTLQEAAPLEPDVIRRKTDEINQAAAVDVPHAFDGGAVRAANLSLFEQVERGAELTADDSVRYRTIYQDIIFRKQSTLRRFDGQLTILANVEMMRPNNVGGLGIAGSHDHHDASMRANLHSVEQALKAIEDPGTGTVTKVASAIRLYKDTTDILTHLGTVPHTKSTGYHPRPPSRSPLEPHGEMMLQAFKQAQFAPVNSAAYWEALWRGLDSFDELILRVQARVNRRLSPAEVRMAGRWDSAQSLGRWLTNGSPARRYRPPRGATSSGKPSRTLPM